jgi:hypothetical protein
MDDTTITQPSSPRPAAAANPPGKDAPGKDAPGAFMRAAAPSSGRVVIDNSLGFRARSEWARLRRSFTIENFKQFTKTLVWVVPLTIFIWIYAEQEQIATDTNIQIHVNLVPTDPNQVVKNLDPQNGQFLVDLQGPRAALDRVEAVFRGTDVAQIPINGSRVDPDGKPVKIPAADQIAAFDLLVKNGVNVLGSIPRDMTFQVDQLVTADATVTAPTGLNLEGSTFDPPVVQIRGPKSLIESLRASSDGLSVTADLKGFIGQKKPGTYTLKDVPLLRSVQDPDLSLLTSNVTAQMVVNATDITFPIPRGLPIWISTPTSFPNDTKRVDLAGNTRGFVTDVVVKGPVDKINLVKDPQYDIHAEISVAGVEPSPNTVKLRYVGLPDGVTVVSDKLNGEVTYTIVSR